MALRAELIGPYCLVLVTSSVCADLAVRWCVRTCGRKPIMRARSQAGLTARMTLLTPTAAALKWVWRSNFVFAWFKGYRSTINSRIRTGTDSGNPTV